MLRRTLAMALAFLLAVLPAALATEISAYQVGDKVEDFTVDLIDGTQFTLSDYAGKTVIIAMWASWCPYCVQSNMPALQQLAAEHPEDIVLLGVNCGEYTDTVIDYVAEHGYDFPVMADEYLMFVNGYFPSEGIPYTVFIDGEGVMFDANVGAGEGVYDMYAELLAPYLTAE